MLAGIIAFELHLVLQPPDYPASRLSAIAARVLLSTAQKPATPPPAIAAWGKIMLGRPLFDPSRRPPAASPVLASGVEIPRLSGIMITPTEKIAVFSPDTGSPVIVTEKSRFGPFTVVAISENAVTVAGPNGVSVVRSDVNFQGKAEKSTVDATMLPGGIDLGLLRIPLPSAASWPGPPPLR